MAKVKPIPDGYPRVTPYLSIDGAAAAIDFYCDILSATERMRLAAPGDKIGHAELQIGSSVVMLADEAPDMDSLAPKTIGGTPVTLMVYVEDVDATVDRAVAAGATITQEIEDRFYGDRCGIIEDPFGHRWTISTHIEDVTPDDMRARMEKLFGAG